MGLLKKANEENKINMDELQKIGQNVKVGDLKTQLPSLAEEYDSDGIVM